MRLFFLLLLLFSLKKPQVGNLFARVTGSSQTDDRGVSPDEQGGVATTSANGTDSQSSGAFNAFRRSYSQMSSFRQSSMSSFSQHAWTNSNSQSASTMSMNGGGGGKQFVWRSESNPASGLSKASSEVAQINSSASQSGFTDGYSSGRSKTLTKRSTAGLRSQSVPVDVMSKGSKRSGSAGGTLFDALSSFKPNKRAKR